MARGCLAATTKIAASCCGLRQAGLSPCQRPSLPRRCRAASTAIPSPPPARRCAASCAILTCLLPCCASARQALLPFACHPPAPARKHRRACLSRRQRAHIRPGLRSTRGRSMLWHSPRKSAWVFWRRCPARTTRRPPSASAPICASGRWRRAWFWRCWPANAIYPALRREGDHYLALWQPSFSAGDMQRLDHLATAMPPLCRALAGAPGAEAPAARSLLDHFVATTLDAYPRFHGDFGRKWDATVDSIANQWLRALVGKPQVRGNSTSLALFYDQYCA